MSPIPLLTSASRGLHAAARRLSFLVPLATRLVIGLAFVHTGLGKWRHLGRTTDFFASLGLPLPALNAGLVATMEFAALVQPSWSMTPAERIGVYHRVYLAPIGEALGTDYPIVKHVLGHDEFLRPRDHGTLRTGPFCCMLPCPRTASGPDTPVEGRWDHRR